MPLKIPSIASPAKILPETVISMFNCTPADILSVGGLTDTFSQLELSCKMQVFNSPRMSGITFPEWMSQHRKLFDDDFNWLSTHRIPLIAEGDNFCRDKEARWAMENVPWVVEEATPFVAKQVSGALGMSVPTAYSCHYINVVDEHDSVMEGYEPYKFATTWRANGGPLLAWPTLFGKSELEKFPYGDMHTKQRGWFTCRTFRDHYLSIEGSMKNLNFQWPVSCLICANGRMEKVYERGTHLDIIPTYPGTPPEHIMGQSWMGLAYGASSLEYWSFDCVRWRLGREKKEPGSILYYGMKPGDVWWDAFTETVRMIRSKDAALKYPASIPVRSGPFLVGRRGLSFLWVVNLTMKKQPNPFRRGKIEPFGVATGDLLELWRSGKQQP